MLNETDYKDFQEALSSFKDYTDQASIELVVYLHLKHDLTERFNKLINEP